MGKQLAADSKYCNIVAQQISHLHKVAAPNPFDQLCRDGL